MEMKETVNRIDKMLIELSRIDRVTVLKFINDGYDLEGYAVCRKLDIHHHKLVPKCMAHNK